MKKSFVVVLFFLVGIITYTYTTTFTLNTVFKNIQLVNSDSIYATNWISITERDTTTSKQGITILSDSGNYVTMIEVNFMNRSAYMPYDTVLAATSTKLGRALTMGKIEQAWFPPVAAADSNVVKSLKTMAGWKYRYFLVCDDVNNLGTITFMEQY